MAPLAAALRARVGAARAHSLALGVGTTSVWRTDRPHGAAGPSELAAIHNEDMHPHLAIFMRRHGSSATRRRALDVLKGAIAAVVSTVAARVALSSRYRLTLGI